MEAIATRSAASCCRRALTSSTAPNRLLTNAGPSGARQKSTSARTRRALNIQPHPSFLNFNADGAARPTTAEIIFNPPSSEPSVYHTPFKFLPPSDPRRIANLTSALAASSTPAPFNHSASSKPHHLDTITESNNNNNTPITPDDFPTVNGVPPTRPRHHLTKADIEEMRALRAADPATHSVQALAQRFQCTKLFVLMCCQAPAEHRAKMKAAEDEYKARWGARRRAAREDRQRRFAKLFGGEL